MTIASKLQLTLDNKNAIKLALQNKGANPTDVFSTYPGLIDGLATSGIATPQIIAPINGATGVAISPIITASRFSGLDADGFADVHVASVWEFASDAGFTNILHTSGRDTENLESYDLDAAGFSFDRGVTIYARVEYEGASGNTAMSAVTMFETTTIAIGDIINGDIVFGQMAGYWLLTVTSERRAIREWGGDNQDTILPNDPNPDPNSGVYNTDVLLSRGSGVHPAAEFCRSLGSEYFLANREEIVPLFNNKTIIDSSDPTVDSSTTTPSLINIANGTALDNGLTANRSSAVLTSTESSAELCRFIDMSNGLVYGFGKNITMWVVPIRRIPA